MNAHQSIEVDLRRLIDRDDKFIAELALAINDNEADEYLTARLSEQETEASRMRRKEEEQEEARLEQEEELMMLARVNPAAASACAVMLRYLHR